MSQEEQVKELLREGIEAAREGDRAKARDKFEQITELDENNEKAWFYLAQVVDTDDEKRVCLSNVLVINPENEKARQQMNRLEGKLREQKAAEEVIPGVSRRQLTLIGGGGAVVVVALVALFLLITVGNANQEAATRREETAVAQLATDGVATSAARETFMAETQAAAVGTATPTQRSNILPPTFTPSPGPTETPTPILMPTPGSEVAGKIVAWGGPDVLSNGALEPRVYLASGGGEYTVIGEELGQDVRFGGNGDRVVYSRYFSPTFDFGLEAININGTQQQSIRSATGLIDSRQPDYCRTANKIAFVAVPEQRPSDNVQFDMDPPSQLFMIDLDANGATSRLTNDGARYTYPAFSPDCTRIAVVRDDFNSAQAGADVVVIDVNNPSSVLALTTDLSTFEESSPRWSWDGSQVVLSAAQRNEPHNGNIVIASANGTGTPLVPIRDASDDIYPVFSPDGAYLAFSSNRAGAYNIFIYRLADGQIFQLTNSKDNVFVGGWWQ